MSAPPAARGRIAGSAARLSRIVGLALLCYGVAGIFVQLRFVDLLAAAAQVPVGRLAFYDSPPAVAILDPLWRHFSSQPALPWLAWLAGFVLLLSPMARAAPAAGETRVERRGSRRVLLLLLPAGLVLLLLGAHARLNLLLPPQVGLTEFPFDDEGVYAGASQLFLQGILPYRDYFFAHPPLAAIAYAPAMGYHFTPWGSDTSFMIARYMSVAYSLLALLGFLLIAYELGGRGLRGALMGATAAGVWALDGRAVEINQKVMLDQPMLLASLLALLLYLLYLREPGETAGRAAAWLAAHPGVLLALAGLSAAAGALTKIQGLACFMALFVDLLWRTVSSRRARRLLPHLLALVGGFAGGLLLGALPFAIAAPGSFARMVLFFQLLRPGDGAVLPAERIANLTGDLQNGATALLAAAGALALSIGLWRMSRAAAEAANEQRRKISPGAAKWLPVLLWACFNVLLFTYSRSFYGHYYIQIAAPLALLAGAIWTILPPPGSPRRAVAATLALPLGALLLALPLAAAAWQGFTTRHEDRIFAIVSRYVNDAVPPGSPVLATDEQFNLLASRPPSHGANGYLVDSYGHLIYLGLGLGEQSWDGLLASLRGGERSDDPDEIMHRPAPQQDLRARAREAAMIVVHSGQGARRLTLETMADFLQLGASCPRPQIERQARYVIVRVCE